MKEIKLSQTGKYKGLYVALVDDEDYERVNRFKWSVFICKDTQYARRNIRLENGKQGPEFMHWMIMGTKWIDHEDNNGSNNQRINLRKCTYSQNGMNRISQLNTSSKYKGVYWKKTNKKWCVSVKFEGKRIHLGLFTDEIKAAKAYDIKAKELFGEFANLNFKPI